MVYRSKDPNKDHWNGLGGKIEDNENILDCVKREIFEEAGIDISYNKKIKYCGIVTWNKNDHNQERGGMHAFIVELPQDATFNNEYTTPEGIVAWKHIDWVCDSLNKEVVNNIPYFLPEMLKSAKPKEYRLFYKDHKLLRMEVQLQKPAMSSILKHLLVKI